MTTHRLRLCAAILGTGILCFGSIVALPRMPREDNSGGSATATPAQRKVKRRRARLQRRRATAGNSATTRPVPQILPPTKTQADALNVPTTTDVDSALSSPEQKSGKRDGGGVGSGAGSGYGSGDGSATPNRNSTGMANSGGGSSVIAGGGGRGVGAGGVVDYNRPFSPRDVDRRARILSKPEAPRTEAARRNNTVGTVVMRLVLTASGEVTNIRVVQGLPDGLSESAVEAARRIKFEPALKDGRAVSQYIQLEYNFNSY